MSWDTSLEIGIEEIDQQHRKLVAVVEELILTSAKQDISGSFNSTLNFIERYAREHFADEEAYQIASGYPKYAWHKSLHEDLIQDFEDIKNEIDENGLDRDIINKTNHFLLDWVLHHVIYADFEFGAYYRKANNSLEKSLTKTRCL